MGKVKYYLYDDVGFVKSVSSERTAKDWKRFWGRKGKVILRKVKKR